MTANSITPLSLADVRELTPDALLDPAYSDFCDELARLFLPPPDSPRNGEIRKGVQSCL